MLTRYIYIYIYIYIAFAVKYSIFSCPICLVFGTVFNSLTIHVFRRPILRETTTGFLLTILAITDMSSLYMGAFPPWIKTISEWYLETRNDNICQIFNYILSIVMSSPPWVILAVTLERIIITSKPLKAKQIATRKNASRLLICIFMCICLCSIPHLMYSIAWYEVMFNPTGGGGSFHPLPRFFLVKYSKKFFLTILKILLANRISWKK